MGIKLNKPSWYQEQILDKTDLYNYEVDLKSKNAYNHKFKKLKLLLALYAVFFMSCIFFMPNLFAISFAILFFLLAGVTGFKLSKNVYFTPARCQSCHELMKHYEYTIGDKKFDYNGSVFICERCNTKFISITPGFTTG